MMLAIKAGPQIAAKVGNPAGLLCRRIWYSVGKSGVLGITEYRQGRPLNGRYDQPATSLLKQLWNDENEDISNPFEVTESKTLILEYKSVRMVLQSEASTSRVFVYMVRITAMVVTIRIFPEPLPFRHDYGCVGPRDKGYVPVVHVIC